MKQIDETSVYRDGRLYDHGLKHRNMYELGFAFFRRQAQKKILFSTWRVERVGSRYPSRKTG